MEVLVNVSYDFMDGDCSYEHECSLIDFLSTKTEEEIADALFEIMDEDMARRFELPMDKEAFCKELSECSGLEDDIILEKSQEIADYFGDELRDFYEEDAMEEFRDSMDYARDPYAYYGVSREDFF